MLNWLNRETEVKTKMVHMKKLFIVSTFVALALVVSAQSPFSLTEGKAVLVYSLPKTQLNIELVTEKITQQPGMFYRYSERYLATNNVITQEKVSYRLKSVKVTTTAIADLKRTFSIQSVSNSQLSKISVNSQGLLCGVNVPVMADKSEPKMAVLPQENSKSESLLPLGEEYMMAGSEAKLAEGAAKQIYRIRESRLSLLTADGEKLPADGASMKSMLDGMTKLEKELTELFVGKTNMEEKTETVRLMPDSAVHSQVLFRFSTLRGLVAADDLSGIPYYLSLKPTTIAVTPADPKSKPDKVGLYYVLPATTQVQINDGIKTSFSGEFLMPQFGKIVPLSEDLLRQKNLKVTIDSQTGRLLSIE